MQIKKIVLLLCFVSCLFSCSNRTSRRIENSQQKFAEYDDAETNIISTALKKFSTSPDNCLFPYAVFILDYAKNTNEVKIIVAGYYLKLDANIQCVIVKTKGKEHKLNIPIGGDTDMVHVSFMSEELIVPKETIDESGFSLFLQSDKVLIPCTFVKTNSIIVDKF